MNRCNLKKQIKKILSVVLQLNEKKPAVLGRTLNFTFLTFTIISTVDQIIDFYENLNF